LRNFQLEKQNRNFRQLQKTEKNCRKAKQEFPTITEDGKELTRKSEGTRTTYWIDKEGNRYEESDVWYLIGKEKVQKVKRTEKVKSYEVVDKMEALNLANAKTSVLNYTETTLRNFEREVGMDKAIKFLDKQSSRGLKWVVAYIYRQEGRLVKRNSDDGISVSDGIREFALMKKKQEKGKMKVINQVVEVKAEELEKEIATAIKL